jgi:filamentous hemagglutinin family protein
MALYSAFAGGVASFVLPATLAWANPQGQQVMRGQATFQSNGNTLTVTNTPGAAINWQSFSIKANETTHFQQANSSSSVLNRVVNNNPSELLGNLTSNGKVVLINPFGITVGRGAAVDTAGFTASTLNITDADWANGKLRFQGNSLSGDVKVDGVIRSANGDVMLFAPNVTVGSSALVKADNGNVIIGAGQKVEVTGRGLEGIRFEIQSADNKAVNLGKIEGNAVGVFAGTLRHSGVIKAQLATTEGGKVVLRAIKDVEVSGPNAVISADGAAGKAGGQVQISSATGDVLIGTGARITANGGASVNGAAGGAGGSIGVTAEQGKLVVEQGTALSANGSPAGSIRLLAATDTRVAGVLTAVSPVRADSSTDIQPISLATGGKVEVLGKTVSLEAGAQVDVSGDGGGGVILVGGDYQGRNPDVPNAQSTNVAPGVTLTADGRAQGDGGKVIVWADNDTNFAGTISAQGGLLGGNGGNAETSGKHVLFYRGRTNLSAARGSAGTLLLDPDSIVIQSGSQDGSDTDGTATTLNNGTGLGTVNTGTGAFTIYESEIENTAANILLVANNKISTSGSFITAGGAITLLSNFNLTMQVTNATNTGDGIDLTGSFNGTSLKFVTQGTGTINLSTTGSSANGGIVLSSLVTAGGTVTVSSVGTLTNLGGITVNGIGTVSLTSGFASSTALTAGSITTAGANLFMTANNGGTVYISPSISTSGGGITAIGAEVLIQSGVSGNVDAGVGNISLTATGATGRVQVDFGKTVTGSTVSFKANRVWIDATAGAVTGTSQVMLAPYDAPRSIVVGGDDTSATGIFGVTAGEIARITTPVLQIGNAAFNTGNIDVTQAVTLPGSLILATGGNISQGVLLPITAAGLRLEGANVFLQSQNLVTTFAAKATNDLFYRSSGSFTVGTVAGLSGAAVTGGGVTLLTNAGGSTITLASDVKSAGGDIGFYTDHVRIAGNVLVDSNTTTLGNAGAVYLGADLSADALGRKLTVDASAVQAGMNGGNVGVPTVTSFGGGYLNLLDINTQSGTGGNKGTVTIAGNVTLAASGTGAANQATLSIANALVNVNSNATINTNGSGATVASDGGLINLSTSTLGGGTNRNSLTLLANAGTGASSAGSIKLGAADVVGAGTRLGSLTASALGTGGKIYLYGNLSTDALTTSGISGNIALDSTSGVALQVSSVALDTSLNNASPQAGSVTINSTTGSGISAAGQGYQLTINTVPANASGSAVAGNVSLPGFDNAGGNYVNKLSVVATTTAGTNEGVVTLRGDVLLDRGAALDGAEASLAIAAGYLELAKPNGTTTLIDTLVQATGKGGAVSIDVSHINTTSGTGFKIDTSSVDNIRKGGDIQLVGTISSTGASTGVAPGSVWLDTGTSVGQISGQIHLYDPIEVANNGAITIKGETLIHGNEKLGNTSGTLNNNITIAGALDSYVVNNALTLAAGPGGTVDTTGATVGARGYLGLGSAAIPSSVNVSGATLNLGTIKAGSVTLTGGTLDLSEVEAYGGNITATGSSAILRNTLQTSSGSISVTTTGSLTVQGGVLIRTNGFSGSNSDGGAAGNVTLKSSGGSITLGNNVSVLSTGGTGDVATVSGDTAYAGGAGGDLKLDANGVLNLGTGVTISSTGGDGGWGFFTSATGGKGGVGGAVSISAGSGALSIDAASTIASHGGLGGDGAQGGNGANGVLPGQAGVGGGNGGDGGKGGKAGDVTLSARTLTVSGAVLSQGGQGGVGALGGNGGDGATGTASLPGGKGGSGGSAGLGGGGGDGGTVSISNTVASTLTLSGGRIASSAGTGGLGNDPGLAGSGGASGGAGAGADGDPGYIGYKGFSGASGLVSILSLDSLSLAGGAMVQGGSADLRAVNTLSIANSQIAVDAGAFIKSNNAGIYMSGTSDIASSSGSLSNAVQLQAPNGTIEVTKISAPTIKIKGASVTLLANGSLASAYGGLISVESTGGSLTVQNNVTISSVADGDGRGGDITLVSSAGLLTIASGVNILSLGGDGYGADWSGDSNGLAGDGGNIALAGHSGVTLAAGGLNTNIRSEGGKGGDGMYAGTHDGPDGGEGGAGGSISISSDNGNVFFIGNNVTLVSIGGNGGRGGDGSIGDAGLSGGGSGGKGYNGGAGGRGGDGGSISLSGRGITFKGVIVSQGGSGGDAGAGGQGGTGGTSASGTGGMGGDGGDAGAAARGGDGGNIEMSASSGSISLSGITQVNTIGGDGGVGASGGQAGSGGYGGDGNGFDGTQGADSLGDGASGTYGAISMTSSGGVSLVTSTMRGRSVSILASGGDVNIGTGVTIQADDSVDVTSTTGSIYMTGSSSIELLVYNDGDLIDLHAANDVQLTYLNGHTMNVVGGSIYSDAAYVGDNLEGAHGFLGASTLLSDVGSALHPLQVNLGYSAGLEVRGKTNVWIYSPYNLSIGEVQVNASSGSGTLSVASDGYLTVYSGTTGGMSTGNVGVHLSGGTGLEVSTGANVQASGTGNLDLDAYNTVHVEGDAMSASGDINITSTFGKAYVYSPGTVSSASGTINISGHIVDIEGTVGSGSGRVNLTSTGYLGNRGIAIDGAVSSGWTGAGPAIVLVTDELALAGSITAGVNATVAILSYTPGSQIDLISVTGTGADPSNLSLYVEDLARINTGILQVGDINRTASSIHIIDPTFGLAANALALYANGAITQDSALSVNALLAQSNGNVQLADPANAITLAAGTSAGSFSLRSNSSLTIGTVAGISGVVAGAYSSVTLQASGDLTLNAIVDAGVGAGSGNRVSLLSGGTLNINAQVNGGLAGDTGVVIVADDLNFGGAGLVDAGGTSISLNPATQGRAFIAGTGLGFTLTASELAKLQNADTLYAGVSTGGYNEFGSITVGTAWNAGGALVLHGTGAVSGGGAIGATSLDVSGTSVDLSGNNSLTTGLVQGIASTGNFNLKVVTANGIKLNDNGIYGDTGVTLTATTGSITNGGTSTSQSIANGSGDIVLNASTGVGTSAADGRMRLDSKGQVFVNAGTGDVWLQFANDQSLGTIASSAGQHTIDILSTAGNLYVQGNSTGDDAWNIQTVGQISLDPGSISGATATLASSSGSVIGPTIATAAAMSVTGHLELSGRGIGQGSQPLWFAADTVTATQTSPAVAIQMYSVNAISTSKVQYVPASYSTDTWLGSAGIISVDTDLTNLVGTEGIANLTSSAGIRFNKAGGNTVERSINLTGPAQSSTSVTFNQSVYSGDWTVSGGTTRFNGNTTALTGVVNITGGTLEAGADVQVETLSNQSGGTVRLSGGNLSVNTSMTSQAGLLDLGSAGTLSVQAGDLTNTGTITGSGAITLVGGGTGGTLINDGTIAPGGAGAIGTISIGYGNLTQGPTGRILMDFQGTAGGTYDHIDVQGLYTSGGTVSISEGAMPVLMPGDQASAIYYGSVNSGTQDAIESLASGIIFQGGYTAGPGGNLMIKVQSITNSWTKDTNATEQWETAANWSRGHAPVAGEDAYVSVANNPTITVSLNNNYLKSLDLHEHLVIGFGGYIDVSGGSLAAASGTVVDITSGALGGSGDYHFNSGSTLNWAGGLMGGSGTAYINAGAKLNLLTSSGQFLMRPLVNTGSIDVNSNLDMSGGSLTNQNTGSVVVHGNGQMFNGTGTLYNAAGGTIGIASGSSTYAQITAPLDNGGEINVTGADLVLPAGQSSGQINIDPGRTLKLAGSFASPGFIANYGGTLRLEPFISTLSVGGTYFEVVPSTLSIGGNGSVFINTNVSTAQLFQDGADVYGTGNINAVLLNASNVGSIGGGGTLTTSGQATSSAAFFMNRKWNIQGGLNLTGGYLNIGTGATVTNQVGSLLDVSTSYLGVLSTIQGAGTLNNSGQLRNSFKSATTTELLYIDVANLNNYGSISFGADGVNPVRNLGIGSTFNSYSASLTIPSGKKVSFGGAAGFDSGSALNGAGTLAISGGTTNFAGSYNNTGVLEVGGTMNFNTGSGVTLPTLVLTGNLGGNDAVTVTTAATLGGNIMSGTGVFKIASGATATMASGLGVDTRTLRNEGTLTLTGGTLMLAGQATLSNAGVLNLGGNSDVQDFFDAFAATVSNESGGIYNFSSSTGIAIEPQFANKAGAQLNVLSGQMVFDAGITQSGTVTVASGATLATGPGVTLNNLAGGLISGAGTLDVSGGGLYNYGTVAPGTAGALGTLNVKGGYFQQSGGTLYIRAGSATTSDKLNITGGATLDGTLTVGTFGGYTIGAGDSYTALSSSIGYSGTFTVINSPAGVTLQPGYNGFNVTLTNNGAINNWIGTDGDWSNPANWSRGHVPLTGEAVTINPAGIHTITLTTAAASNLYSLDFSSVGNDDIFLFNAGGTLALPTLATLGGTMSIAGGVLSNANVGQSINKLVLSSGTLSNSGSLYVPAMSLSGGQVSGSGTLYASGGFSWTNGLFSGVGLETSGATTLASGTHGLSNAAWINYGTVTHSGGNFSLTNATVANNGVFTDTGTGGSLFSVVSGTNIFHNNGGTFNFSEAGSRDSGLLSAFNNDGTINVAGGATANIQTGGTDIGYWDVAAGGTLQFASGSRFLASGAETVKGAGKLNVSGGVVSLPSPLFGIASTGTVGMTGGTLDLSSGSAISFANAVSLSGGSSLRANNGATFAALSLATGATLSGGGNKLVTGTLSVDNSTLTGGTLTTQGNSTLSGTLDTLSSMSWLNQGSLTVSSGEVALAGASLTNASSATLRVQGAAGTGFSSASSGSIVNNGAMLWTLSSGSRAIASPVSFSNSATGTLSLQGGTMDVASGGFTQAGTLDLAGGTTFKRSGAGFANTGRIQGTGTVLAGGNLDNNGGIIMLNGALNLGTATLLNSGGSIRPGDNAIGTLTVTGNVNYAGGTVNVDLASTSSYDRIVTSLNNTTGGSINVTELTPFIAGGDSFNIITFGGASGGTGYTVNQTVTDVTLGLGGGAGFTSITASAVTNRWKDNISGDWATALNWSRGHAPNSLESVVISPLGTQTITLSAGSQAAKSLTLTGDDTLLITGGSLGLATLSTIGAGTSLLLQGGSIDGAGALNIGGILGWSGGTFGTGGGTLSTTSQVTLAASGPLALNRNWTNTGTIAFNGGDLQLGGNLVNQSGGIFNVNFTNGATDGFSGNGTLTNQSGATFNVTAVATASDVTMLSYFVNNGAVNIHNSLLDLHRGATQTGSFSIDAGKALRVRDTDTHVFGSTSSISGAGYFEIFNTPTVTVQGTLGVPDVRVSGGTLNLSGAGPYALTLLSVNGGTLAGSANVSTSGAFGWNNGTIGGSGTLSANGAVTIDNTVTLSGKTLRNASTMSIGTGGTLLLSGGAVLNNLGTGTLNVANTAAAGISFTSGDGSITNAGVLNLLDSTIATGGGNLSNSGQINASGLVNLGAGTLSSSGTLSPGGTGSVGTLAITGNLDISGGTVKAELASSASYDRITVTGNFVKSGTIAVSENTPFIGAGDAFNLVTYGGTGSGSATLSASIPDVTLAFGVPAGILQVQATAVTNRWKDNLSGDWATALNWSRGHAPNALEDVIVNPLGIQLITVSTGSQAAKTLSVSGDDTLAVNGGTLNLSLASTIGSGAGFSVSSGSVIAAGSLGVAGAFNWSGGTVGGTGQLVTTGAAALSGSADKILDNKAWNVSAGTVNYTGGSVYLQGASASLNVGTGATFNVLTSDAIGSDMRGLGTFNTASGSTLNLNAPTGSNSLYTRQVNLSGTTNLLNGDWDFDRDTGGTTINLNGALNMANGTRIRGYSTLGGPVVTLNVNAGAAINVSSGTATLDVNNWDLFFNTPMTLPAALNVSHSGNTVTAGSALAVGGAYTLSGGTLTGAGSVALNGSFNWGGGTVTGAGTLSTAATSTLGNTVSLDGKAWNNTGSISIGSGTTLVLKSGAQLNNLAAGTLSVANTGGQGIGNGAGGGTVSNAGLLDLNNSTIATGGGSVYNTGLLKGSGTLDLAGSGTFTNTGTVAPGGTGTIGLIAITGHASLAAGVLQAELDSTSSYDQLTVSGNLVQGGTIAVSERATPFVGAGDTFNVVGYGGTLTGSASTVTSSIGGVALSLNSGLGFLQLEAMTVTNSWKDNVSGDWSIGTNWTRGHAPNSQEDAVIAPAGFQTITLSAGAQSPRSLQLTDNDVLTISGGTLSISNASTVVSAASLLMSGGMLAGAGNLDIAGTFVFSGGTLGGTGTMSTSGASTIATGVNPRTIARDWSNYGTLTWDSGSVSLNSHLFNKAGAMVNINIYDGNDDLGGFGTLANAGGATVRVSSSAFDTTILATLVNDGDVFIDAGKLDLHRGATHLGTFTIASGAELRTRDNETHTFAPGSAITGAGTYRQTIDAPTVYVQGDFTPANVVLGTGTLAFSAGGTQSVSTLAVNGGTLSLGGTLSAGSVSITTAGASLVTVNGSGLLDATQLSIDASGASSGYLTVGSGAAITTVNGVVYGKVGRTSGSDIVLDGRLSEDNGTAFTDYLTLNDATIGGSGTLGVVAGSLNMGGTTKIGAVLEESSSGQIDFGANGAFTVSGAGSRLNGNVRVLSGAVADFTGANLSQSSTGGLYSSGTVNISNGAAFNGIVSIDGGNFNVSGPAVTVSGASASVFIGETSTLNVNGGTLSFGGGSDLWNSGLLHVAAGASAELSTTGYNTPNVTQAGTISIDAGGTFALLAGGNYSSVAGATPAVTGAGKLLVSGGTLTAGSAVDVGSLSITSGSVSVTGADLKAGGFNQTGGSVTGNGNFTVTSSFNQSAGTLGTGFNNISITQQTGNLAVGSLQAVNTVTLSAAGGSITDTNGAATNVTGSSVKLLALSGIDLDLNTAVVDATLTSAGSLDISNTGALQIAALSSQGSASITTAGTLTQSGAINVIGATTLSTGGAGVTLTHLANDFGGTVSLVGAGATSLKDSGTLAITGGASSLSLDGGAVQVGTLTVSGPLTIVATGQIGQSGGISVTGLTNLSAASIVLPTASTYGGGITFSSTGDVTLNSGGAMVLGGTGNTAGGNVSLTALGPVSQTAALTVNGTAVVSAAGQPVNFGTQLNDFASVSFTAASVQVRDINSLAIGGNVAGNVAVQAASGASGGNFSFGSVDVTLSGLGAVLFSGVDVAGAANFATSGTLGSYSGISYSNNSSTGTLGSPIVATGLVDLAFKNAGIALPQIQAATLFASGGGAITQTGPINAGVTHISGQSALLNIPSNHLGALTLNTGNASIVDAGALNLSGLASGTLQVQAGAITQSPADALITGSATISGAGGIALIGANELGALSASSSGAITLNDVGATLALGNVTTPASLAVQSGGAVMQMAGTTLSSASLDMIALSIGSPSQALEFIAPVAQLFSAQGDLNAHSAQAFNLVGLGAAGKASVASDGALTVSGTAEATGKLSLKGAGLVVKGDVSGSGVTLDGGTGTLDIGGGAAAASVTGAQSVALLGHDITLLGGTGQGAKGEVVSEGSVTVNAAGNFVIRGGAGSGALAQVSAFGPLSITVGGVVSVEGGKGTGAYAKLDPAAQSALTVNAQSVSLLGGSGAGAYAAIVSEGDVIVTAPGGITMATHPQAAPDADAVVISYFGRVTLPNCNGCVKLTTPPLGNGVTDVGVLGGEGYVAFLGSGVVGTNEILQFQAVFDVLVDKPKKPKEKEDIVIETVCRTGS